MGAYDIAYGAKRRTHRSEKRTPTLYEALENRVHADKGTIRLADTLHQIVSVYVALPSDAYFVLVETEEDESAAVSA